MSEHKKNIALFLLIGIIIGVMAGGGFVWWQLNITYNNLLLKSNKDTLVLNQNTGDAALHKEIKTTKDKKKKTSAASDKRSPLSMDSLQNDYLGKTDTSSFSFDSINTSDDGDIVVKKDELLFTRKIKLFELKSAVAAKTEDNKLDSLLTDDKSPRHTAEKVYTVEFWKSPINYQGYKMTNNKLILFGIYQYEFVSLYRFNNSIYLKYLDKLFILEKADDFKSFVQIKDKKLIEQIHSK